MTRRKRNDLALRFGGDRSEDGSDDDKEGEEDPDETWFYPEVYCEEK